MPLQLDGAKKPPPQQAPPPPPQKPINQQAYENCYSALGAPYGKGGTGPTVNGPFDCSGLIYWAYLNASPSTKIPRVVADMWNNNKELSTVWDEGGGQPLDWSTVQTGDLLIWLNVGAGGSEGHVMIYNKDDVFPPPAPNAATGTQPMSGITTKPAAWGPGPTDCVIDAPHTGAVVELQQRSNIDFTSTYGGAGIFRGIKRVGGSGSTNNQNPSSGDPGTSNPEYQTWGGPNSGWNDPGTASLLNKDLPDPRSNLPFSAYFLGQQINGGPKGPNIYAGRSGSFTVQLPGVVDSRGRPVTSMPGTTLVRGGMSELMMTGALDKNGKPTYTGRAAHGTPFRCYFMMNPTTIGYDTQMATDGIAAPTSLDPTAFTSSYLLMNITVSFTIVFNRMYEVWMGNVPGPSQLGVRWDIRSVERLMGMYDADQLLPGSKTSGTTGEGNYSAGNYPPMSLPLQVVFGGPNSLQFQGVIAQMDYTYTMFDMNMVPVEASCDLQIMRLYMPQNATADLVNALDRGNYQQIGKPVPGPVSGTVNATTGLVPNNLLGQG